MANEQDLLDLQDPRETSGPVQAAINKAVGEEMLDPAEELVNQAIRLKRPLATSHPEDICARYGISPVVTGAALEAAVAVKRAIGSLTHLKAAVIAWLQANFTFAVTPTVVVYSHASASDAHGEDLRTFSVRIPAADDNGTYISRSHPGLLAEIRRVAPPWPFTVTHTANTRSAEYAKSATVDPVDAPVLEVIDVLPSTIEDVKAATEDQRVISREAEDIDWFQTTPTIRLADNDLDGEEQENPGAVAADVRIKASSESVDNVRAFTREIVPSSELLGGFPPKNPVVGGVGIKAITAEEKEVDRTYDIADDIISLGVEPAVKMIEPPERHAITVVQERRLVPNIEGQGGVIGPRKIFDTRLTREDSRVINLAGRTVRVELRPISGGVSDREDLQSNDVALPQDILLKDPSKKNLPNGNPEVLFAREYLEGPTNLDGEKPVKRLSHQQILSFRVTVSGVSAGSTQHKPPGLDAGLNTISVDSPGSDGATNITGFPSGFNPLKNFLNIQQMHVEAEPATVTIVNETGTGGGGGTVISQGLVPFTTRPEFQMLDSASECSMFGLICPNFFDMINFPAGGATPGLVDISWQVVFKFRAVFDLYERLDQDSPGNVDQQFLDFSPPQDYPVTDVRLDGMPSSAIIDEYDIKDAPYETSIVTHRLIYDKNKLSPATFTEVKAYATYDISSEDNSENINIGIPTPEGWVCDRLTVHMKTRVGAIHQTLVVNLTDVPIANVFGDPVYKRAHLDTLIDATKSMDRSIATVILFIDRSEVDQDFIIDPIAHFTPSVAGTISRDVEDLQAYSFSTFDELPVDWWDTNVQPFHSAWFTESQSGHIYQVAAVGPVSPKRIRGGVIFYFEADLDDAGLLGEVQVRYTSAAGPTGGTAPADIQTLKITVPQKGRVGSFRVSGIVNYTEWYVDADGFYWDYINNYKIASLELHFDKNQIPTTGVVVEVWVTYIPPGILNNQPDDLTTFSARQDLLMESVDFDGLVPKKIYFDTVEQHIIEDALPEPMHVRQVLVVFSELVGGAEKVEVAFRPTYWKKLKEVVYATRQDWTVTDVVTPALAGTLKSAWLRGELTNFQKFVPIVDGVIPQRCAAVRFLYYDTDLSEDVGSMEATIHVREIISRRIFPFVEEAGPWTSPNGFDAQFRVDMEGVFVNRVEITGSTSTPEPIRVWAHGYEQPYEPGQLYNPERFLFYYKSIQRLRFFLDLTENESFHPRHNALFDNAVYWESGSSSSDERLEIQPGSDIRFNQVLINLAVGSLIPDFIDIRVKIGESDFLTATIIPAVTTASTPCQMGATEIVLTSTTGFAAGNLISLGADADHVRVLRVLSSTRLRVDPIKISLGIGTEVKVVGFDFGDVSLASDLFIIDFRKGGAAGAIRVRQVRPRLERRFVERAYARNVIVDNDEFWAPEGSEGPESETSLTIVYPNPVRANRLLFSENVPSEFQVKIANPELGMEQEVFLSRDEDNFGYFHLNKDRADDPKYDPEVICFQIIELFWARRPRNPATGLYQPVITRCLPQFVFDPSCSKLRHVLDENLHTFWATEASDVSAAIELTLDLKDPQFIDRHHIVTSSPGVRADVFTALGADALAWRYVGTLLDIAEPGSEVTQALSADAGPSEANPDWVPIANTTGFEVGAFVHVVDDLTPEGEYREIISIVTNTRLVLAQELTIDFTTAQNAAVTQANVLCPGSTPPIITGVHCVGPSILGPRSHEQALALTSARGALWRYRFTNFPLDADGRRTLRIHKIDPHRRVAIP